MTKTKLTLNICGIDYTISSDEEEKYVRKIAEELSQKIISVMDNNSKISASMATTLVALEYCDASNKASLNADNLRSQIKNYLEDLQSAREKIERQEKEIEELKFKCKV